ncbi:MAG: site-specific DNA-methyltransferase [Accumulibacter sp.]|jgi:adenine-specific DNA-methyltransferase|uniref:site-specific DNA-methyltransferase n=1 Tax=Accumulibacter sp. TaxID=2053492 RepID=UPI002FC3C5C7
MLNKRETDAAAPAHAGDSIASLKYPAKRKNIPPAGLEAQGVVQQAPKLRYEYNPHLPPMLRSATDAAAADKLPELLAIARQRALSADEAQVLADALRRHEPWLEWSGKREKPWFEVEPVALHMHERISTQAILRVLAREDVERDLFADPQHDYAKAVQFYQHDVDWANRMILGDSLQVMASLARREDLAGKVQMIYLDPPYGIKFASNFQPQLGQRDVKDREQDLTREPEMVKAYRDTWTLGIHSYLAYLRDRLAMARELLADSGSIFVQISDENLHRVRCVMDEVFGEDRQIITFLVKKKGAQKSGMMDPVNDYLLWYGKSPRDSEKVKFREIFVEREVDEETLTEFRTVQFPDGAQFPINATPNADGQPHDYRRSPKQLFKDHPTARIFRAWPITNGGIRATQMDEILLEGNGFKPPSGRCWSFRSTKQGPELTPMERLREADRLCAAASSLDGKRFLNDFPFKILTNWWDGLGGASDPVYVVQTNPEIIARCLLMTTDPGDLVLDPTCGSGTTAYVAEQWGRRWITCDSSRVALALAKHRLLTAKFDYHQLRPLSAEDVARNPNGTWLTDPTGQVPDKATFACKTVPHITLKSIARNTSLDPIFARHEPILAEKLATLNDALTGVDAALKGKLVDKLIAKHRQSGANAVTDADMRRWLVPETQAALIRSFPARSPLKGLTTEAGRGLSHHDSERRLEGMGSALRHRPGLAARAAGSACRLPRRLAGEDGRGERLYRRQRRNGRTGGQTRAGQGRGARERPVLDGGGHRGGRRSRHADRRRAGRAGCL